VVKGFIAPPVKISSAVRPTMSSRRLAAMTQSGSALVRRSRSENTTLTTTSAPTIPTSGTIGKGAWSR
jgi:hypothetical protein